MHTAVLRQDSKRIKRLKQEVQELRAGNERLDRVASYNRQMIVQLRSQLNAALKALGRLAAEKDEREDLEAAKREVSDG
jgi:hypothetical protein